MVCLSKTPPAKLFLKMLPSFDASRFLAEKTGSAWSVDANLMVPALSSCSEYQGIHFPLEPTKKWQHDATCMRFFFGNCWNVSSTQNTTADCVCILCTMIRPNMWSIRSVAKLRSQRPLNGEQLLVGYTSQTLR